MLSIGKLQNNTGKAAGSYYLESVAKGKDDYYVGRGEAEGQWIGSGNKALGLEGAVDDKSFLAVLARRNPETGVWLGALTKGGEEPDQWRRTPGFDLTFSAPKSVSVLWGLAGESVSERVQEAHDIAVGQAMRFVEERVAFTRRGHDGVERISTTGLTAAAFRHRCSRAGDPALHTHCVVANVVLGTDGRWSSLDARLLFAWGKTAGYLYQATLRKELVRRLGVEWGEVHRGTAEVDGVAPEVCRVFSQRRQEIEARMEAMGGSSAKAAQIATLDTRRSKEYGVDGTTLHDRWRARGAQLGMTVEGLEAVTGRDHLRPLTDNDRSAIAERLSSRTGLTERASTFGQREVIQAWCDQLRQGGDVADVLGMATSYLATPGQVIPLGKATELRGTDVIRREDGTVVATETDEYRYSTLELLDSERRLVEAAVDRRNDGVAVATPGAIDRAIVERRYLSDEQAALVRTVTGGGDGVVVVIGRPGTGKTTALNACRDAWEASRHRVVGCALAAETARTLQRGSGIESFTVTQLVADLVDKDHGGLPRDAVVVVDEAGMVGTRQLLPILEAAARDGAKLVLVGDDRQLPEIDAGGAFRGLRNRCTTVELTENRRQREAWERYALERLRGGAISEALATYQSRDAVVVGTNADDVRRQLVDDWWRARRGADDAAQPVIIAARRTDVDRLNEQARALRVANGDVGGPALEIAGREFAVGDRVVTLKNASGLGVRNGMRGTVTGVDEDHRRVTVHTDDGTDVDLPESYAARRLRHAYALTGHKAQGKTVTRAFILADDATYREWAYTALSRGQDANRLYVIHRESELPDDLTHGPAETSDALTGLARSLERTASKIMAIDAVDTTARPLDERVRQVERKIDDINRVTEAKTDSSAAASEEESHLCRSRAAEQQHAEEKERDH